MDISKRIAELKLRPDFAKNVGMILVHNGVVRQWSRKDGSPVSAIEVTMDMGVAEGIRRELLTRPGIYEILIEANQGHLQPGDDLLFLVVAGDLRENVKPVLADLLDRIKAEAVSKREIIG
jgi:molybdopterin synthase catalytic subunit